MRYSGLIVLLLLCAQLRAQDQPYKEGLIVKTYSPTEWNKWFFASSDLVAKDDSWKLWTIELWGMSMTIQATDDSFQSWEILGTDAKFYTIKKKKFSSWQLEGEGRSVIIQAQSKDLSTWLFPYQEEELTARLGEEGNWNYWRIEGDMTKVKSVPVLVATIFIPVFCGSVLPQIKVK